MQNGTWWGLLLLSLAALARPAVAQNLVGNSGFDTDLAGWSVLIGNASWSAADCCGNSASGSASFPMPPFAGPTYLLSDCIDVTGGATYDLIVHAATLAIPPDFLFGEGTATVTWYSSGTPCSTPLVTSEPGVTIPAGDGWRSFGTTFIAPPDAVAVKVTLIGQGGGLSTAIDVHFDDVTFGPTGSVPVTLQSFVVD